MKKLISLFLSLVLVGVCLPLAAAQDQSEVLRMSSCDTALEWVNGAHPAMSVTADNSNYTEAPCSLKITGDLSKGSSMVFYTRPMQPMDISSYTHLEFDFYTTLADKAVLATGGGQIELSSSGKCDVAELVFSPNHLLNQVKADGWNHISIPLTSGHKASTHASQVYDPTGFNFFRFYLVNLSGQQTTYSYTIDNMYFSNGSATPDNRLPVSTYQPAAPCQNNGYLYGDANQNGRVGSDDALTVLRYVVEKDTLINAQLAMADVNADGKVQVNDALMMLNRSVGNVDVFPIETLETLPEAVEVGINEPHLVHTQYPTDRRVIAETGVIYWGAVGDGVTDDTAAFRKAIAYVEAMEGGTVFVPAGRYVIKGTLTLPNGVTLQGDSPAVSSDAPAEGTILMAYAGRGDENGTPFLSMDSSSAIANLSIWYPEQTMDNITPYPWTIKQIGHYGLAISNVRLVNSYQGIGMFYSNSLQNIRKVVGTPLKTGLILDGNVDICRVEEVAFTPDCWINSGLSDISAADTMKQYLYDQATAFKFEHVDWTYVTDIVAHGYHVALGNSKPTTRQAENSPNGHVFNVDFRDCYIGYEATYVNAIGMMITEGTIHAQIPVFASQDFDTSFSLNHLDLIATGDTAVVVNGIGYVTLEDCSITAGAVGIQLNNGHLSATRVSFANCTTHIDADRAMEVMATNCMTKDTLVVVDRFNATSSLVWDDTLTSAEYTIDQNYNADAVARPAGDAFVNVANAPYNVSIVAHSDITTAKDSAPAIQKALDDVKAQGGGVVYVPSGRYRLDSAITVPTGVELRGSITFPQHSHAYSTTFYTRYGLNMDREATALITLEPSAGIAGFKVYYDEQPGGFNDCEMYAFTVRGTGINNYILDVNFINSFYQTDFATNRCDGHYINGATGFPLEQGIVVGGGSRGGIVRDCQFNVHYFSDNPYYKTLNINDESFRQYATDRSEAFVVEHTTDQIMYHNFVLGVHSGIAIDQGADVFVLAHGTDGGDRSMTVRGTPSGDVIFVNTQLVVIGPGTTKAYVNIEDSFTGTVNMTQTNLWGQPTVCSILVGGGTLKFSQGTNIRSGTVGAKVWNGASLFMDTVNHVRGDVLYDLQLDDATTATTYGNFYRSGGLLYDEENVYKGIEFAH